ncbi:uncharacterized protein PV09_09427 [Verruconis gallopava]|uniref:Uncharacterized protein n=1 Tax=Verruconis gallopava TaxID=253628 RepID=A0A0D2AIQ5_9PEZI|nr:uncharacterized protein PV09_09427 [Verruconis gallopava]KIV98813.1 hypothetical protein PV09_09427 [Verruconis gallopava]
MSVAMPAKTGKRSLEDQVFSSKPVYRQRHFRHRVRAVQAVMPREESPRPRKRRRIQTTMTQLELGRRSFLDVIGDSDGDEESADERDATRKPARATRKSRLPAKTESQDTLTQFVKRSSDHRGTVIRDSEDEDEEATLSDDEGPNPDEAGVKQPLPAPKHALQPSEHAMQHKCRKKNLEQAGREYDGEGQSSPEMHTVQPASTSRAGRREFTTPKKIRVLPVPSSRSPPDTHLSTQVTPRLVELPEPRSPLEEKSVNIQSSHWTSGDAKTPNRLTQNPRSNPERIRESPSKRRVRDFNARLALFEKENARSGMQRQSNRSSVLRSSTRSSIDMQAAPLRAANCESQYPMPGIETQDALFQLPAVDGASHLSGAIPCSGGQGQVHLDDQMGLSTERHSHSEGEEGQILIPSSQTQKPSKINDTNELDDADLRKTSSPCLKQESLPGSTYTSKTALEFSLRDTQDLASDQLMRETQQMFFERVPSSPPFMTPSARARSNGSISASPSRSHQVRPSQATTVDETMTSSSLRGQHGSVFSVQPKFTSQTNVVYSSPLNTPRRPQTINVTAKSKSRFPNVQNGLADLSSSPRLPEPKTPSILRNLKAPLRLNDLVSDSLEHSYPMPPSWRYDEDQDEDEDDEL